MSLSRLRIRAWRRLGSENSTFMTGPLRRFSEQRSQLRVYGTSAILSWLHPRIIRCAAKTVKERICLRLVREGNAVDRGTVCFSAVWPCTNLTCQLGYW